MATASTGTGPRAVTTTAAGAAWTKVTPTPMTPGTTRIASISSARHVPQAGPAIANALVLIASRSPGC
ncbi:MAG: hypothetical protein BGO37_13800 [Cellulomonas sp. 73-92]|nr:MAG: hypothetical protein BGO37_13800 [Cellulomonas sp. 73-92]